MRRTPLQQIGDRIGMYAYLAAMRGLRYWPGLRQAGIVEQTWHREPEAPQVEEFFNDTVRQEYVSERQQTPGR